jgi:glycosyltransferase involved in cell wall biosynthesis
MATPARWRGHVVFPADAWPVVSVIMPVRNEADFIAESLGAVLAQDYPCHRMEVLIADGLSTDGTREMVTAMAARHPQHTVRLVDNPGRIVATGLNAALRLAKGDVVVRVDGHCRIAPDYVSRCLEHIRSDQVDGVGGSIHTIATTAVGQAIAAAMSSPFGVGGSAFRTVTDRTMFVDTVPFPAYTRRAIDVAGPFDEELVRNQDDEYNYRLRKLGARILLAADVRSDYYSRTSLRSLWRQYFQYGFFKVRVMQKHVLQMQWRHFVPPAFVVFLAGGALAALAHPLARALWLAGLATYAAATAAAAFVTARRTRCPRPWLLLLAFPILHVSYGSGFLAGLVAFARRGRSAPAATGSGAKVAP